MISIETQEENEFLRNILTLFKGKKYTIPSTFDLDVKVNVLVIGRFVTYDLITLYIIYRLCHT